jgi:hypothetical protein
MPCCADPRRLYFFFNANTVFVAKATQQQAPRSP